MTEHTTKSFWQVHKEQAVTKALYREYRKEMTNLDTKIAHPQECKPCPEHKQHHPHPEAAKRIIQSFAKKQDVEMPTVITPERFNRR